MLAQQNLPLDDNLAVADFTKLSHNTLIHHCYQALDKFRADKHAMPKQWDSEDAKEFVELYKASDPGELTEEK